MKLILSLAFGWHLIKPSPYGVTITPLSPEEAAKWFILPAIPFQLAD